MMNAALREQIMESYRLQREKNAREERRRREEVAEKDPRIGELMQKRHEMILSSVRSAFEQVQTGDLEAIMRDYNRRIRELLKENGFPENYLEPVYACELCRDTGYVGEIRKTECVCMKKKAAQLTDRVTSEGQTFECFDETVFPEIPVDSSNTTQRRLMRVIRTVCEKYADNFPNQQPKDLLLYGGSGLGKTFLLSCIFQRVLEPGYNAECVTAYDMQAVLRRAYFAGTNEADSLFNAELLLVDDLGMEPLMENVTAVQLYNLLNERRRAGLPTVFSSNLTMQDIKTRYTERVSSRLLDAEQCRVLHLLGKDIRLIRKKDM